MKSRKKLPHGVRFREEQPAIVFLAVNTYNRRRCLAAPSIHQSLISIWSQANAWRIGRYVLMPDHLHLFAAPGPDFVNFDNWVRYWKSEFVKAHLAQNLAWQTDHWDRRMRSQDSYDSKLNYVRNNPVRAGLVENPDDWPFQGVLNPLTWH